MRNKLRHITAAVIQIATGTFIATPCILVVSFATYNFYVGLLVGFILIVAIVIGIGKLLRYGGGFWVTFGAAFIGMLLIVMADLLGYFINPLAGFVPTLFATITYQWSSARASTQPIE